MCRIKLLVFKGDIGFKKLNVTEKQLRLLSLLHKLGKLKEIKLFDIREVSPIDERVGNYINIGNVDFSFTRVQEYFKETMHIVTIRFEDGYEITEYASTDRIKYLKEDMLKKKRYKIDIR